jgi:sn-glycerol 3-phosphate transport system substrate-binding protein
MRRLTRTTFAALASSLVLTLGATSPATAAPTELTMYYPVAVGGPLTKIVDDLVGQCEKQHPDIKVNAVYAGNYNDARIKALTALRSGQPAQLSVMFAIDIFELIDQNAIEAFDDLATTPEEKAWLNVFYPTLMENGRTGGKTWGVPFQRSTIVMYYNKDAFREAGLDPSKPPATWEELTKAAEKLVKKDASGNVVRWGIEIPSTGYPYWMFGALAMENGEVLMNSAGNKTYFDKPGVIHALQYWRDLGAKYKVMPSGTVEWGTLRSDFLEQKTAIMWHSTGNLTAVKDHAKFDFGVAMLPAEKRRGTPTGGGNFYIFKKATPQEKKAAFTFIRCMTEPALTAEWSIKTGYLGTRPDAYETAALKKYVQDFSYAAVARDQLQYATAELSTHENARVRKLLDDAIQAALTGAKSPADALRSAQRSANSILRRYR